MAASRPCLRFWTIGWLCVIVISLVGYALADDCPAERRIREELLKPTQFQFNETPLKDVVTFMKDLHGINIEIHREPLIAAGTNPDDKLVTRNLSGISLKSALNLVCQQLSVTYIIENEVLLITTPQYAQQQSMPRVYDISEWKGDEGYELLKAVELAIGSSSPPRAQLVRGRLVVRGSEPEHQRIVAFLDQLRNPRKIVEPAAPPVEVKPEPKKAGKEKKSAKAVGVSGVDKAKAIRDEIDATLKSALEGRDQDLKALAEKLKIEEESIAKELDALIQKARIDERLLDLKRHDKIESEKSLLERNLSEKLQSLEEFRTRQFERLELEKRSLLDELKDLKASEKASTVKPLTDKVEKPQKAKP